MSYASAAEIEAMLKQAESKYSQLHDDEKKKIIQATKSTSDSRYGNEYRSYVEKYLMPDVLKKVKYDITDSNKIALQVNLLLVEKAKAIDSLPQEEANHLKRVIELADQRELRILVSDVKKKLAL